MIERKTCVLGIERRVLYSECERYRYLLAVTWQPEKPSCQFIGLNPSTATEIADDPTLRRCRRFAADWGFGGMLMTNVAAFRATDPQAMLAADDPIGPENTPEWIAGMNARVAICAWGGWGARCLDGQCDAIRVALGLRAHYLRLTKGGAPGHPLYLPASLTPQRWGRTRERPRRPAARSQAAAPPAGHPAARPCYHSISKGVIPDDQER